VRSSPQKIAILGGGVGAMAAAFALTDQPGWQDRYTITVYQLGWRLGGKGASGRNAALGYRIEEHGLHVWLGFYENAFRLIQRCYDELDRPAGTPLATWRDAFTPHTFVVFQERINGTWQATPVEFPTNARVPGQSGDAPRPWEYLPRLLEWMLAIFRTTPHYAERGALHTAHAVSTQPSWWDHAAAVIGQPLQAIGEGAAGLALEAAHTLASPLDVRARALPRPRLDAISWLVQRFIRWLRDRFTAGISGDPTLRHAFIQLDIAAAVIAGMIADDVISRGFDAIDDRDLRDWLIAHGAAPDLSVDSAWVRAAYDLVFGFRGGDPRRPAVGAGTALRGTLRMLLDYRGAIMYKMQAGMGDVVFAPLYEVLRRRGVEFAFFHRVTALRPAPDGRTIEQIEIARQATPRGGRYDPLITVNGLPCWPSAPRDDQLLEGPRLRAARVNLESAWCPWPDVARITLTRGRDFDLVILGISLGALRAICADLAAQKREWAEMLERVQTCRTQAAQIWLRPPLRQLGWDRPPISGAYVEPLDTWADMSHLIDREAWSTADRPGTIAYFCGPMEDDPAEPPPFSDPTYPERQAELVKEHLRTFLAEHVLHLMPGAARADTHTFDWDLLIDPAGRTGADRLAAQFWRANIDPSERYVLSVPGSVRFRLPSDRSGYANLYLAGDWTRNGLNAGCVEAAVISGLQVSRAISGAPAHIVGETD
jgi:uncharacterized protein with NAD-binding domain and iron-sulfur cluster